MPYLNATDDYLFVDEWFNSQKFLKLNANNITM